ncbi:DUF2397 family protein [Streptomyces sp. NPDC056653]|uniref:DUF2397 family protein n=1 Tax=Streptomyces sp. NPDC056653 TaxID=3345894 RepID=UPI0036A87600
MAAAAGRGANHAENYRTADEYERRNLQYSLTRRGEAAFAGVQHALSVPASTSVLQTAVLEAITDRLDELYPPAGGARLGRPENLQHAGACGTPRGPARQHGPQHHGLVHDGQSLVVAHQAARAHQPAQRSLYHPPARQHHEPRSVVGASDDLRHELEFLGRPADQAPGLAAIRPHQADGEVHLAQL